MLLIGLESSRSPHQCYFGHCFRCSSVQHTFVAVKPTSASFFSNLHALSPWGAPELLNSCNPLSAKACRLSAKRVVKQKFYLRMTFGFLGFGKMASALVQGMLQAGVCKPEQILVINRHPETIKQEVQQYGLTLAQSPRRLVQQADTIVLGTKPIDSVQ